jgi:hypothetical protein
VTSIIIALLSSGTPSQPKSLIEQVMEQEQESSPATLLPSVPGGGEEKAGEVQTEEKVPQQE